MGALSDTTSGRTSPNDPIVIPVGEGATKDPDMAAEIKGRFETEGTTNSSAEEKLTINNGTQVADTKVVLTPENQERLDKIKIEIEKDKQEAIREAAIREIGSFLLKTFLNGGISLNTAINMFTNNSLADKIDKIEHSMELRETNAERAGVDCGYKKEYDGETSKSLQEQSQELKNDINTLNQYEKDFARFDHLSLPSSNETLMEKANSICDAKDRDAVYEHRDEIISGLKSDLETLKTDLKAFDKEHRNDDSAEIKAERSEMTEKMRELNQSIKQMDGFEKTYESLAQKLDVSSLSNIKGCEGLSSPKEVLEHKEEIIKDIRQEINHLSHGEFVLRAEEKYGEMSKSELQSEYASHKEEVEKLEHFRNANPGDFNENMREALKIHKEEMREIECVDRIHIFESDSPSKPNIDKEQDKDKDKINDSTKEETDNKNEETKEDKDDAEEAPYCLRALGISISSAVLKDV